MVYVQRLIIACMFLLGLSLSAHAETVRISGLFNSPTGTTSYSDGQSYCMSASLGAGRTPTGYIGIGSDKSTIVCSFLNVDGSSSQMGVKHYCLKGGQADTAQFGCYGEAVPEPEPEEPEEPEPIDACEGKPYTVGDKTNFLMSEKSTATRYLCVGGCKYSPSESWCIGGEPPCFFYGPFWRPTNGSLGECNFGEGGGSGEEEEPEEPSDGTQEEMQPTNCPAGTCPGTVNGNAVCLACNSNPVDDGGYTDDPNNPNSGSGGEEGGGTGTGGTGEGNGSGTGTGTGTGGSGTDEEGGNDGWEGTCKNGFTCDGDALICAISQAEYKRNCELFENPEKSDEYKTYNDALEAASAADKSGEGILSDLTEEVDISNGRINTSSAIGSGSCLKDVRVDVLGKSIVLPLSDLCPYLAALGNVLMAISFLLAARIILRG